MVCQHSEMFKEDESRKLWVTMHKLVLLNLQAVPSCSCYSSINLITSVEKNNVRNTCWTQSIEKISYQHGYRHDRVVYSLQLWASFFPITIKWVIAKHTITFLWNKINYVHCDFQRNAKPTLEWSEIMHRFLLNCYKFQ